MSAQGGRRSTDHRTSADIGVLFDAGAEEKLALAEKRWRAEWNRRAETIRREILTPSEMTDGADRKLAGAKPEMEAK